MTKTERQVAPCITCVSDSTDAEWDEIWSKCPYATYFHSRQWSELWESYTHGLSRPAAKTITFSDGVRVLMPLTRRKIFAGLAYLTESSPAGTYGGWISRDALTPAHEHKIEAWIDHTLSGIVLRNNPYYGYSISMRAFKEHDTTQRINLDQAREDVLAIQTAGHRRAFRKAERLNLGVRHANTLSDWTAYYAMYEDSIRRWGKAATNRYAWDLFDNLRRQSNKSTNVVLWLAIYDDTPIAGAICLSSHNITVYWHGAALNTYFYTRAANFLLTRILEHTAKSEAKWFDFNPSGGHAGVKVFKQGFGAVEAECSVITRTPTIIRLTRRVKAAIART